MYLIKYRLKGDNEIFYLNEKELKTCGFKFPIHTEAEAWLAVNILMDLFPYEAWGVAEVTLGKTPNQITWRAGKKITRQKFKKIMESIT